LIAVRSLALGIGANRAIFTLIDRVLPRALPVKHPEQLVRLDQPGPNQGSVRYNAASSYPMYKEFRDPSDGLQLVPAIQTTRPSPATTLEDQAPGISAPSLVRLRKTLVVAQIALSTLLLAELGCLHTTFPT
jgi:hypothetical protein